MHGKKKPAVHGQIVASLIKFVRSAKELANQSIASSSTSAECGLKCKGNMIDTPELFWLFA